MNRQKPLNGLDLCNQITLDDNVQSIGAIQRHPFVGHWKRYLSLKHDPALPHLQGKTVLVR